ncbi:MAG: flagellar biosynthesis protein FlhF [Gammaproteobacteria bacterium]|nr:flagellar biosynthesis protein FlhF [Gammaproteobacteria bacterium]
MGMKVKRYFAETMRQALEIVREAEGPDVMILSNRKVEGGVELLTAIETSDDGPEIRELPDVDLRGPLVRNDSKPAVSDDQAAPSVWTSNVATQSMQNELRTLRALVERQLSATAWRDFKHEHPLHASLVRGLAQLGMQMPLARAIASEISELKDYDAAWRHCLAILAHKLRTETPGWMENGGIVAFVGPAGAGKSTVLAKLAARFALTHGADSVALIAADNVRIAAQQQLRAFGRILGVAVRSVVDPGEVHDTVASLQRHRLILIDTAGLSPADDHMVNLFRELRRPELGAVLELVVPATTDYRTLSRTVQAYVEQGVRGAVLTRMDEAAELGACLSVLVEQELSLNFVCAGQKVPDDIEVARAHQVVARAVQLTRDAASVPDNMVLEQAFAP